MDEREIQHTNSGSVVMSESAWSFVGPVRIGQVPTLPRSGGVYRLTFFLWDTEFVYIGQTDNLPRRIREYSVSPTQGNKMEHLLFDLLKEAEEAQLHVSIAPIVTSKDRLILERKAILEANAAGVRCINKGNHVDSRLQRFRLKSEIRMLERELSRARGRLEKLSGES